jgi:hypothetical protein
MQSAIHAATHAASMAGHTASDDPGLATTMRLPLEQAPAGSVLQHVASMASNAVADLAFAMACGGAPLPAMVRSCKAMEWSSSSALMHKWHSPMYS